MLKRLPFALIILNVIALSGCTLVVSEKPFAEEVSAAEEATSTLMPTNTPNPPTKTATPSPTSSPTATDTPLPPTATATATPTADPLNFDSQAWAATGTVAAELIATATAGVISNTQTLTATGAITAGATSADDGAAVTLASASMVVELTPTATPIPTATPQPTKTPLPPTPTPPPATQNGLSVYETAISINTFNYQPALVATQPGDAVYPYPRMDHNLIGALAAKPYRAIILENKYLQLTILPDLGGRIYKWIDKTSGKNLFYRNPVIKPTVFGHRGWWLGAGGMEWALPLDEHGLVEASPWEFQLQQTGDSVGVILTDTEEHSGLYAEIMVSLDAEHAYFTLAPRIFNPTQSPITYKFWINGMFGLGENKVSDGVEFVFPAHTVKVHGTADLTVPKPGGEMSWPTYNGRNLSDYGTWTQYLGVFASPAATEGFMGAYNHNTNLGVARVFPPDVARGIKIFGPGDLDPAHWTTDGSNYFELWGGVAPTFDDELTLEAGQWVTWQEYWYAIGDMGGFQYANQTAALNLGATGTSLQLAAAGTRYINGQLVLTHNGQEVKRWPLALSPSGPFRTSYTPAAGTAIAEWGLTLLDETGTSVASIGQTQPIAQTPASPASSATPTPTAATSPSSPTNNKMVWDPRLDDLGITLSRAAPVSGKPVYRLVAARYWDDNESRLLHHIFAEVIDEYGRRLLNESVVMAWDDDQAVAYTEDKPAPEYAANFPMYNYLGKYRVFIDGAPSDVINGLGLPGKHHVSYLLTFQKEMP